MHEKEIRDLAIMLYEARYPDPMAMVATALIRIAHDGIDYGVGPHHTTMRGLGLVSFGKEDPITFIQAITPTCVGMAVAGYLRKWDHQKPVQDRITLESISIFS